MSFFRKKHAPPHQIWDWSTCTTGTSDRVGGSGAAAGCGSAVVSCGGTFLGVGSALGALESLLLPWSIARPKASDCRRWARRRMLCISCSVAVSSSRRLASDGDAVAGPSLCTGEDMVALPTHDALVKGASRWVTTSPPASGARWRSGCEMVADSAKESAPAAGGCGGARGYCAQPMARTCSVSSESARAKAITGPGRTAPRFPTTCNAYVMSRVEHTRYMPAAMSALLRTCCIRCGMK
mmetsp:Transcript_26438/g.81691  ORF Transcript_26438/g.81691 Transcript_26438/m.81691 type:complete len:239 (+) Transcript_26438:215-931(+)